MRNKGNRAVVGQPDLVPALQCKLCIVILPVSNFAIEIQHGELACFQLYSRNLAVAASRIPALQ